MSEKRSLHHSFDIELASKIGIVEAILVHHFSFWISYNRRMKRNFKEGRTWTYQTIEEIAAHFPYLSIEDVRGAIERLCTGKGRRSKKESLDFEPILIKGNFNKTPFDKTLWYAFKDEEVSNNSYEREISQIEKGGLPNPNGWSPKPIPDTKPDAETSSSSSSPSKEEEEELQKRFRERPSDAPKIKSKARWRETVLKDIRNEAWAEFAASLKVQKRKLLAQDLDGKKINGMHVVAGREYVEISHGSFAKQVRYDVSDEEWASFLGWK